MKKGIIGILSPFSKKSQAKLIRVVSITAGGNHAWCESDQGNIRKPLSAIPKDMLDDFRHGEVYRG